MSFNETEAYNKDDSMELVYYKNKVEKFRKELASLREQLAKENEIYIKAVDDHVKTIEQLKQKEDENRELKSKAQELYNYIEAVTMKTIHQHSPHTQDLLRYLKNLSA